MKLGSSRTILGALATTVLCLLGVALAHGQAGPEQKQPMAEKAFKNVKVLTGIPVDEFTATMGFFAASLSMNCTDCHASGPTSQTSTEVMIPGIETCKTCHGTEHAHLQIASTCITCHAFHRPEFGPMHPATEAAK